MKKITTLLLLTVATFMSCEYQGTNNETNEIPTTSSNEMVIIDFEEFATGEIISAITPPIGTGSIGVFGTNPQLTDQNVAMIFDSSNPTGGDVDLGSPNFSFGGPGISSEPQPSNDVALGKVLILSQDGDQEDPDDSWVVGSKYDFDFSNYGNGTVTMFSFDLLDLDLPSRGETIVTLYGTDDSILFTQTLTPGENNAKQVIDLEATENVARMELLLQNSGAIDNIKIMPQTNEVPCKKCKDGITNLVLKYNGTKENAKITVYQYAPKSKDNKFKKVFDSIVQPGGSFSLAGADENGTLGRRILIKVNGYNKVKINTNCYIEVGPGFVQGDFEVLVGSSKSGGELCPIEVPDCNECDGGVTELTLKFEGFRNSTKDAKVQVYQKIGRKYVEIYSKKVAIDEEFTITGHNDDGTFGHETVIVTNGKHKTKLFTGCQCPIGFGYDCAGYELLGGKSKNGGNLCPIEDNGNQHFSW